MCASSQEKKGEGWFSSQEKKEDKVSFCHYNNFERRTSLPVDVDQVQSRIPVPYRDTSLIRKRLPPQDPLRTPLGPEA